MKRRWMLAGLVLVAIVAIAVPALAGDSGGKQLRGLDATRIATASKTKARHALGVARKARKRADRALKLAEQGAPVSPAAIGAAFAQATDAQSTSSETQFVSLPGGPSLTLKVPQSTNAPSGSGFLQVAASARVGDAGGAVSLFEDGSPVAGQGDVCQTITGAPDPTLFASIDGLPGVYATPGVPDFGGGCASGAPAPVYFTTTTGTHSYELRYLYCGCSGTEATFSQRRLWITPLG